MPKKSPKKPARRKSKFTAKTADKEPRWRVKGSELRTGYQKTW